MNIGVTEIWKKISWGRWPWQRRWEVEIPEWRLSVIGKSKWQVGLNIGPVMRRRIRFATRVIHA